MNSFIHRLLPLLISVANIELISSQSQFCSTLQTITKQDQCPNSSIFNIQQEHNKSILSWKLNFSIFGNASDQSVLNEIERRYNKGVFCPYIRQTNTSICCDGWQGLACDQPSQSSIHPSFPTCHLWGRDHLRTFDGTYYRFPGSCVYKLVGAMNWQINIQFINCTGMTQSCQKILTVVIGGKTLEIVGAQIHNLTSFPSSLTIRRQEKNLLDLYFTTGLRLKIDQQQESIVLQFDPTLMTDQTLSGLCADANQNRDDDLKLFSTGEVTLNPVDFGNQWKLDRNCPDVSSVISSCVVFPDAVSTAIESCQGLTNQSQIFQSCLEKINIDDFHQACLHDVCLAVSTQTSLATASCQTIEAYVEECDIYPLEWRSELGCVKRCSSSDMVHVECVPSCTRTCSHPNSTVGQCHSQTTNECIPGCICSNDTVYDALQDRCIPLEECTCQYNDQHYQPGDQVSIDCNDCQCDHGRWICTNRTCPRTCLILGDMNIWTFDGKQYALTTPCNQVLVETTDSLGHLRITYSSTDEELTIEIGTTKVLLRSSGALINGNARHTLPYQTEDVIIRRASTVFIEVRDFQSTVVVHFDPLTSRVYVKLDPSFINRVRGLCGTFNYVASDDFLTPNHLIETNLVTFANAYLASTCSVPEPQIDTCYNFPANEQSARVECTNLLKHPIFSSCVPRFVDLTYFLTSCIRDLCTDQSATHRDEVKCSVLSALARACASKGILIDWMSNDTLARLCQSVNYGRCGLISGAIYSECVSECRSSCTDIDLMPSSCLNQCLPGCQCQSGQLYDEHSQLCRIREECSCYDPYSEQYIHPSHSLLIERTILSNCSCSNASLQCNSSENNQCHSTQIYALNTTLCPRTCSNYFSYYDCGLYGPGCACPPGQILLNLASAEQRCVSIDQCPCQYSGQYYLEHETILQQDHGCQNCTCQEGGRWSCQKIICTKTCSIFGHSHYQTFDGLYYNFPGQCQYILVKETTDLFRILTQNIPCGSSGRICSKNLLIEYNGMTIDLIRGRPILVNSLELLTYHIQPVTFGSVYIYQLGIYTIIKSDDFTIQWDGETFAEIKIQSNRHVAGLCGNNNDNFDDDLNDANGAAQNNIFEMAKSWQTSVQYVFNETHFLTNYPCGNSIDQEKRRIWARSQCDWIKTKSSVVNNPFQLCIEKMEAGTIEKYYQACLYEACHADHGGDCDAVCTVITAFASQCQSLIQTPIIKWRSADRCPVQCDYGKVYMACGPQCPQSCFENENYGGCIADSGCVDGCFCPHGQVMDNNGQCVARKQCPCQYDNQLYPQSSRIRMRQSNGCYEECECHNGSFLCDNNALSSCVTSNCTSNQFQCQSTGQCIPLNWHCDRIVDCTDGSDELKEQCDQRCSNQTTTYQCANGQCIDILHRCDGISDCRDGSDEWNCTYVIPCQEYQCPISQLCIPKSWICDGTVDCGREDNSDESGDCKKNQCDVSSGRYFRCRDNFNCLPIDQRCDAHQDCNDGSDEFNCSSCTCTSSFSCLQTCQCIDSRRVCDGWSDCLDQTDEFNCSSNCQDDEYTCLDGKCLNRTLLCDGIRHCSKGEDETHPDCSGSTSTITKMLTTLRTVGNVSRNATQNVIRPLCQAKLALLDDRFLAKPEISVDIHGSLSDLNPNGKGIDFLPPTSSTPIVIVLSLKKDVTLINLVHLEIPRPSNVNQFQLTLLDEQRQVVGHYQILSTKSPNTLISPMINKFPLANHLWQQIRFLKIQIIDTNGNHPPRRVTIQLRSCFKRVKSSRKSAEKCIEIDAMNSRYTTRIIEKLGGTRPFNSSYGNLLLGYGGVTYNTSQAVIDVRFRSEIFSRVSEVSIPDYRIHRTNVKKMIVELFDRDHQRLFQEKTDQMIVKMNFTRQIHSRYLRVSILETNDDYAPYNVTLSIRGCFYRKHPSKPRKRPVIKTTIPSSQHLCVRTNALDPSFAYKIIGQLEGTQPLPGFSFLNLIKPGRTGLSYPTKSPVILIRFQSNVVGRLDEISLINYQHNIREFQVELFDVNQNSLFTSETIYPQSSIRIPSDDSMFVSTVQVTILNTMDDRPVRGLILSIMGCYSTFPAFSTISPTTTTTVPSEISPSTTPSPARRRQEIELMDSKNVIIGLTTSSRLVNGDLGKIHRKPVTFADRQASIDVIFHPNLLISLSSISINSSTSNVKRFRIELLNDENDVQHTIESSSMVVHLESLPSMILAGIRLTFVQPTDDDQPARNVRLSIRASVKEIFVRTKPSTTTARSITTTYRPRTTPITPDHCTDIDAMDNRYSLQTLAGLTGTNPRGKNASLLDLIHGKSISFDSNEKENVILFIVFKANLFVYLKHVGLSSQVKSNVQRMKVEYLDKNQIRMRTVLIDYSTNHNDLELIEDVGALKITILQTFDGKPAENIRLTIRGCFGIHLLPPSTTKGPQEISVTTPTPCHQVNLMKNSAVMKKTIAYIAGTNPIDSSSIFDYFHSNQSISFNETRPTLIIVFRSNIYVELKSISIDWNESNVRNYQIDLIDHDRTILQTIQIDRERNQSMENYSIPINALQITFLQTNDQQTPRNIVLTIEGCFGIDLSARTETITSTHSTPPIELTTPSSHEIELMNQVDSNILIDSITGTLPNRFRDYFNESALVSYETHQRAPIDFLLIFKSNVMAEIHSISLISSTSNVQRFQIDLIDDEKSIVQTIESDENLTVRGFTEIGIAAIRISYLQTKDQRAPENIRLSIRGCFGILPSDRSKPRKETPGMSKKSKGKCRRFDAMSETHRKKVLAAISNNVGLQMFSPSGFSLNSTTGSIEITLKSGIIGNIELIRVIGDDHNIKKYQVIFFDINRRVINEQILGVNEKPMLSVDFVSAFRFVFLETTDQQNIRHVKLSIFGCFFKVPGLKVRKEKPVRTTTTTTAPLPPGYCRSVDVTDRHHAKQLLRRLGGNLDLSHTFNSSLVFNRSTNENQSSFFLLEFNKNIFIRNLQRITLRSNNRSIQRLRIEFLGKHRQLLKRLEIDVFEQDEKTSLYSPIYPIHVRYLKVTILRGKANSVLRWSIIGCFDRLKKIKTVLKTLKYTWWTVSCIHSNILAARRSLRPAITGSPLPIEGHFHALLSSGRGISYAQTDQSIMIEITFPPGIIGRIYEVGIRSSNVYRIRVQLVEVPNGLLYTLTTPRDNETIRKDPNPRLTGFPPVHTSAIRIYLLETNDLRPARQVKIYTNGCFYKSSVKYTTQSGLVTRRKTTTKLRPRANTTCAYSPWTLWRHCSVSCGMGVQIRARNRLSVADCNDSLVDYRMCQLQPCMCVLTKEFYTMATGQPVPADNIVGYLKPSKEAVRIGDILDTGTLVYAHNCSQLICSNVGLDIRKSNNCQRRCLYLHWSPWSSCRGPCGSKPGRGVQVRQRLPLNIFSGSQICQAEKEIRSCRTATCDGACLLSSWSKWSSCSKSCNLGVQQRTRYYLSMQPNCTDQLVEKRDCNAQCCASKEVPVWSAWSSWSDCSKGCAGGERKRYRTCSNTTSECQQQTQCPGANQQIEACNTQSCHLTSQVGCTNGMKFSNCSNACGHTCQTLTCRSCNEPSICESGCVCSPPSVMDSSGKCVLPSDCLCQTLDGKTTLVPGQTMVDRNTCENCTCLNGCLECVPSSSDCSTCQWSQWSPFGVCSSQCNGTQTRYRSRTCSDSNTEIDYENGTCSTNETFYQKGCAQCSCDNITGEEFCHVQCAITPEICSNITNDPLATYEYIPPSDGQCCGSCERINKTELCTMKELPLERLSSGDCVSVDLVAQQQCFGQCISGVTCRCCSPSRVEIESISMNCRREENNSTIYFTEQMFYAKIESCSCQECS